MPSMARLPPFLAAQANYGASAWPRAERARLCWTMSPGSLQWLHRSLGVQSKQSMPTLVAWLAAESGQRGLDLDVGHSHRWFPPSACSPRCHSGSLVSIDCVTGVVLIS